MVETLSGRGAAVADSAKVPPKVNPAGVAVENAAPVVDDDPDDKKRKASLEVSSVKMADGRNMINMPENPALAGMTPEQRENNAKGFLGYTGIESGGAQFEYNAEKGRMSIVVNDPKADEKITAVGDFTIREATAAEKQAAADKSTTYGFREETPGVEPPPITPPQQTVGTTYGLAPEGETVEQGAARREQTGKALGGAEWFPAQTQGGQDILRTQIPEGMKPEDMVAALVANGVNPDAISIRQSVEMGTTSVRVTGAEAIERVNQLSAAEVGGAVSDKSYTEAKKVQAQPETAPEDPELADRLKKGQKAVDQPGSPATPSAEVAGAPKKPAFEVVSDEELAAQRAAAAGAEQEKGEQSIGAKMLNTVATPFVRVGQRIEAAMADVGGVAMSAFNAVTKAGGYAESLAGFITSGVGKIVGSETLEKLGDSMQADGKQTIDNANQRTADFKQYRQELSDNMGKPVNIAGEIEGYANSFKEWRQQRSEQAEIQAQADKELAAKEAANKPLTAEQKRENETKDFLGKLERGEAEIPKGRPEMSAEDKAAFAAIVEPKEKPLTAEQKRENETKDFLGKLERGEAEIPKGRPEMSAEDKAAFAAIVEPKEKPLTAEQQKENETKDFLGKLERGEAEVPKGRPEMSAEDRQALASIVSGVGSEVKEMDAGKSGGAPAVPNNKQAAGKGAAIG